MLNNPDWSSIFAPNGRLLKEGEKIFRANLSRTLSTISKEGANAFYTVRECGFKWLLIFNFLPGCNCRLYRSKSTVRRWDHDACRSRELYCQSRSSLRRKLSRAQGLYLPCPDFRSWYVVSDACLPDLWFTILNLSVDSYVKPDWELWLGRFWWT